MASPKPPRDIPPSDGWRIPSAPADPAAGTPPKALDTPETKTENFPRLDTKCPTSTFAIWTLWCEKMQKLWENGIKTGLSFKQHKIDCDACKLTKALRPHAESTNREGSTEPGQLIWSDVLVLNIESKEGYMYVVHFTDDFSRYSKIYFLKKRSDIYEAFKQYIIWFEKEYNKQEPLIRREIKEIVYSSNIRELQTDQAGEYTGTEMEAICDMYRIKQRFSSAYLHENAAIAERIWETLQSMVRAMLHTATFPKSLWPIAFRHAAYLHVRLPHAKFNDQYTPYEKFYNKKPDLSNVKVFGCTAYAFIDKGLRKAAGQKLDDRAEKCVYVGNDEISTSYLLLDISTQTVFKSGMVTFVEDIEKFGKMISSDDMPSNYDFSIPDKIPQPYIGEHDAKNDPIQSIQEINIFLDHDDNEIYGLVCMKTKNFNKIWIKASDMLSNNPSNCKLLKDYLISRKQKNQQNDYYPLFAIIKRKEGQDIHDSIIVSHDRIRVECYGVVDEKDGYFSDIRHSRAIFPADNICLFNDNIESSSKNTEFLEMINSLQVLKPPKSLSRRTHKTMGKLSSIARSNQGKKHGVKAYALQIQKQSLKSTKHTDVTTKHLQYKEPKTYKQVLKTPDKSSWLKALWSEIQQLKDMKSLKLLKGKPQGKNIVDTKFVYKLKLLETGDIEKYKVRLVAKGYTQIPGIDYYEAFSPTPQTTSIRIVLVQIIQFGLKPFGLDVSGAFLNSKLEEEIYIKFPDGIKVDGCEYAQLLNSLYGLHQAGINRHKLCDHIILSYDPRIKKLVTEPCMYYLFDKNVQFVLTVHVDDLLGGCNSDPFYEGLIQHFKKTVQIQEKGIPTQMLQMKLDWNLALSTVSISQERQIIQLYIKYVGLENKKMFDSPMDPKLKIIKGDPNNLPEVEYLNLIGALYFIARMSRPDVYYAVNALSRMNACYTMEHWRYLLRVLIYLYHTKDQHLTYRRADIDKTKPVTIYGDSSFADDPNNGRSTSGNVCYYYGNPVSWQCEQQIYVALSTSESEYVNITYAFRDGLYIINILQEEMGFNITPITTYIDNIGAGYMAESRINNKRTKHIHYKYHKVRESIELGLFDLVHVHSNLNVADIFTKALERGLFQKFRQWLLRC